MYKLFLIPKYPESFQKSKKGERRGGSGKTTLKNEI
jgi:hypothetical protein